MPESKQITAVVNALIQDPLKGTTAVLLEGKGRKSILPIWIGLPEAVAISNALSGRMMERPLTHVLILNVVRSLNGIVQSVEVNRMESDTFFAVLHVKVGDDMIEIDARPSDAIAIALNAHVPIRITENVWKNASVPMSILGIEPTTRKARSKRELTAQLKKLRQKEAFY